MERSDVRWQKRRKNRCGKPCTVHIAKDPGYLGLEANGTSVLAQAV